jgi:methylsterol monooxygenase
MRVYVILCESSLLHHASIYKYIHKVHHDHQAPFGIAAEYAHPIETAFLGLGTIMGPVLCAMTYGMHLVTLYVWLVVRVLQTVEVHSGYDFPWSLNNWVPFWGGAEFHDYHHKTFVDNYSSTFTVWDSVFGTNTRYLAAKERNSKVSKLAKSQ